MAVSMFTQSRFPHRDMSGINITPLVDVMLVLLIIFMVQSVPRDQSIDMALSQVIPPQPVLPPPQTLLSVGMDGRIRMEGASISPEDLGGELAALKARMPASTLALEASDGADYGLFARVLAEARNAGFADVALRP
jgi:biopolymer transport protein ExbD